MGTEIDKFLAEAPDSSPQDAPTATGVDKWLSGTQEASQLDLSVKASQTQTPDDAARILKLQAKTGLPADLIQRNTDSVEQEANKADFDAEKFRRNSPVVAQWMAENPNNSALIKDDVPATQALESTVQDHSFSHALWMAMGHSLASLNAAMARAPATAVDLALYPGNKFWKGVGQPDRQMSAPDWLRDNSIAKYYDAQTEGFATHLPELSKHVMEQIGQGNFKDASRTFAIQVAANAPIQFGIIASSIMGLAAPEIAALMFGQVATDVNQASRKAGADPTQAAENAILQGAIVSSLGSTVKLGILHKWEAAITNSFGKQVWSEVVKDFGKTIAGTFLGEGSAGVATQVGQDFSDYITGVNPNALDNAIPRAIDAGLIWAGSGLAVTPMTAAIPTYARLDSVRRTNKARDFYTALGDTAQAMKLRERLPKAQKDLIERMTKDSPASDIYVPVTAMETYFQEQKLNPTAVAQELGVLKEYTEAKAAGTDVKIPLATWADKFVGTTYYQAFADNMKLDPNDLTVNQQKQFVETMKAEEAKQKEAVAQGAPAEDSRQKVIDNVVEQLKATGMDEQTARTQAAIYTAFGVIGERMGVDPAKLYAKYGLKIEKQDAPVSGPGLEQAGKADAQYLGELDNGHGETVPTYKITKPGHPLEGSTVTAETLQKEGLEVPSKPSETLVAMHNLSTDNLIHADKMGGLAVPSLSIGHKDHPFDNYGEITLVGDKNLVNPNQASTKVFNADIYSPRYPTVRYEASSTELSRASERMSKEAKDLGLRNFADELDGLDFGRKGLDAVRESTVARLHFLRSIGEDVAVPKKEAKLNFLSLNPDLEKHVDQGPVSLLAKNKEFMKEYRKAQEAERERTYKQVKAEGLTDAEAKKMADADAKLWFDKGEPNYTIVRHIQDEILAKEKNGQPDYHSARNAIRDAIGKHQDAFDKWVRDNFGSLVGKERIYDGEDKNYRRKYLAHTLENVVRVMRRELQSGEGFNYGLGNLRATVAKRYRTIKEIQGDRDKLMNAKDFEKAKELTDQEFQDIISEAYKHDEQSDHTGAFGSGDRFVTVLIEGIRRHDIEGELKEFGFGGMDVNRIKAFLDTIRHMPTEYFEAKIQRAVGLHEFSGAVIPKNSPPEVKAILEKHGLAYAEYDRTIEGDRAKAVADLAADRKVLFQSDISAPVAPPFYFKLQKTLEEKMPASAPVEQVKGIIKDIKAEERKWSGIDDFLKDKEKVSKQDLMDFLRASQLQVREVIKGESSRSANGDDAPIDVQRKAQELQERAIDDAVDTEMGNLFIDSPDDSAVTPIESTDVERIRRADDGQPDMFGEQRNPVPPEGWIVTFQGDEIGVYDNEAEAQRVFDEAMNDYEDSYRDEAYRDMRSNIEGEYPVENFYEEARSALGLDPTEAGAGEMVGGMVFGGASKFGGYVLEGMNKDYRELLFTLPRRQNEEPQMAKRSGEIAKLSREQRKLLDKYPVISERPADIQAKIEENRKKTVELMSEQARAKIRSGKDFTNSHFDESNVFAHVRFDERTVDGKKVLFLEEIQSDWHQQGRKTGYSGDEKELVKKLAELNKIKEEILKEAEPFTSKNKDAPREILDRHTSVTDRINILEREIEKSRVPDAPFRSTWHEFVLKRMIRYAAENGFDRIAWTTGEQQVERYGSALRKAVDRIDWEKTDAGVQLVGFKNGRQVVNTLEKETTLSDAIGKSMADTIAKSPDKSGILEGDNIKISDTGMAGFYDRILPQFLDKFTKKFGGKVGDAVVETGQQHNFEGFKDWLTNGPYGHESIDAKAEWSKWLSDRRSLRTGAKFEGDGSKYVDEFLATKAGDEKVHSLEVTPPLKEAALKEGFSMFQAGEKGPRAMIRFGPDRQFNIDLLKTADTTSFLHETGHLFLEVMADMAQEANAPQQIRDDFAGLLNWLGVESRDKITAKEHEQFARGFEAYLMEGRAPSAALRPVFARFRAWLIQVYRQIKNLNVSLTPEVRGIFDRMLATDQEIANARAEQNVTPLFADPKLVGMTDEQATSYLKAVGNARLGAEEELGSKIMRQWDRARKLWWQDETDKVKAQVTQEVNQKREYIALAALQASSDKELPPGVKPMKLSRSAILNDFPDFELKNLPRPAIFAKEGGIHPDMAAEIFGYRTGSEMLFDLETAENKDAVIARMTDERMKQAYGDIMTDGTIATEAMRAVHNGDRAKLLQTELQFLATNDLPAFKNIVRKVSRPVPTLDSVRQQASEIIDGKAPREIKPDLYKRAESKANGEAVEAMLKGDLDAAFQAKQRELLNHELFRSASKAMDAVDSIVTYLSKFDKASVRERMGKAGGDYLAQIDGLVDRFDFRKGTSLTALDKRKSLASWVQEQEAAGQTIDVPESLLNEARSQHYKDTPYADLVAIRDTVKNIEHLAILKNKLIASSKARDLQAARDEIIGEISAFHNVKAEPIDLSPSLADRFVDKTDLAVGEHTRMEFFFDFLGGYKGRGVTWEYMFKPMADAENDENDMRRATADDMREVFKEYTKKERAKWFTVKMRVPEMKSDRFTGEFTKANILTMALNWGNEYNREALMEGHGWNEDQVMLVLSRLDARDLRLVQNIWRHINSFWPRIADQERRLNGVAPEKVAPAPFDIRSVDGSTVHMEGGYYPIVFDAKQSWRQTALDEKASIQEMFGGNWARAMTRHGHTIERQGTGGKPLLLDLSGYTNHVSNVIHDLAFRAPVIDVSKLINDPDIRGAMEAAAGRNMVKQLNPWLHAIAGDRPREYSTVLEGLLGRARMGATVVNLGLKITSALTQTLGYTLMVNDVGVKYSALGLRDAFSRPWELGDKWQFIVSRSKMMRDRLSNYDRDVRDYARRPDFEMDTSAWFTFVGYMDLATAIPAWLGAYRKAMDGAMENVEKGDEKGATDYADQVVRTTQAAGSAKDNAAVQRGTETYKLFTMFYSSMSILFNQFKKTGSQFVMDRHVGRLVGSLALQWFLPAVLEDFLRGKGPGEDDDAETVAKWLLRKEIFYPFSSIVIVRDLANAIERSFQTNHPDYTGSPAFDVGKSIAGAGVAAKNLLTPGESVTRANAKDVAMTVGYFAKLPTKQLWLTGEYLYDWMTGNESPEGPVEAVQRSLLTGKKKE